MDYHANKGIAAAGRSWPLALFRSDAFPRPVVVAAGILLFAAATAIGARIAVPLGFTPVPMTLQTLPVLLAGAVLGPWAGALSQLLYLGLGATGVPVFSGGGVGLPWLFGPTGGYLMAFPLAAAAVGLIGGSHRARVRTAIALAAGTVLIFAMGAGWLLATTGSSPGTIFALAVQPFVAGAIIKAAVAYVLIRQLGPGSPGR